MGEDKPWEKEEFVEFLNDINELATNKYGWNVGSHNFETNEWLEVVFIPAVGSDAQNRKF